MSKTTNGIGFIGLLGIVFIVLKLIGIIKWSWVWVLSPVWIPMIFYMIVLAVILWISKR